MCLPTSRSSIRCSWWALAMEFACWYFEFLQDPTHFEPCPGASITILSGYRGDHRCRGFVWFLPPGIFGLQCHGLTLKEKHDKPPSRAHSYCKHLPCMTPGNRLRNKGVRRCAECRFAEDSRPEQRFVFVCDELSPLLVLKLQLCTWALKTVNASAPTWVRRG